MTEKLYRIKDTPRARELGVVGLVWRKGSALVPLFGMCEIEKPVNLTDEDLQEVEFHYLSQKG
jgi:hypothetical protein